MFGDFCVVSNLVLLRRKWVLTAGKQRFVVGKLKMGKAWGEPATSQSLIMPSSTSAFQEIAYFPPPPSSFRLKNRNQCSHLGPNSFFQEAGNTFPVLLFMFRLSPLSLSCWGDGCGATTPAAPVRVMDLEASSDQSGTRVKQQPYGSL